MVKIRKDKVKEAAEAISAILREDIFGCEKDGYRVGDYIITTDGLLIKAGKYKDELVTETFKDYEATPITDRKETVKLLESFTGQKAIYLKAPTYAYKIGDYLVDRDGKVTREEAQNVNVIIPFDGNHTGRSLSNLIFLIKAKGELLTKAIGVDYSVNDSLVKDLKEKQPETIEAFREVYDSYGVNAAINGAQINDDELVFACPLENTKEYTQLFDLINRTVIEQKRINPKVCKTDNEKFTFRTFLISLGMKGDTYREARKILLKNLDGNGAFRTQEQAEKHKEKMNGLSKQTND